MSATTDKAEAEATLGYRAHTRARSTGTLVVLVDGFAQGLETPGTGAPRWFTVCDEHGGCVGHYTIASARSHLAHPEAWCETCSGAEAEAAARQEAEVARVDAWRPKLCPACGSDLIIGGRCIDCNARVA